MPREKDNRQSIDSRSMTESPEYREQELTRKLIEAARIMINAHDEESGLVKVQLVKELEGTDIHFYTLQDLHSLQQLDERPFKFRRNDLQSGWLGAKLDQDTLLMCAVDPTFHVSCPILMKTFELDKGEWQYGIAERGRLINPPPPPVFQDVEKPAVFKRCGQGEDGQVNWKLAEKGKMDFGDWFRNGSHNKKSNPEYAARAHAKATLAEKALKEEQDRRQRERNAREQEEQRGLLQRALEIKQRDDKLWEDRKAEEARLNVSPYDELKKQIQERHAQLAEEDQQYLHKELRYRLRDDFRLDIAKGLRQNAERASQEIGFFKGLTQQGKNVRAYLGDIGQMLSDAHLRQVEEQDKQRLVAKKAFESVERTRYFEDRRACQREAAELFDKTILPYLMEINRRPGEITGEIPKPSEEWKQDDLWKWLEECAEEERKRS